MIVAARACEIIYNLVISTGTGAEYIVPANCCNSVSMAFAAAGVQPIYVDIDRSNLAISHRAVKEQISVRSDSRRVLLYIRPYGDVRDIEDFFRELKAIDPTILIVDDRCLCFPRLRVAWQRTTADVILFSTGQGKVVQLGFGGYAFVRDGVRYEPQPHPFDPQLESRLIHAILETGDEQVAIPAAWIDNTNVEHENWYAARVFLLRYLKLTKHVTVRALYRKLLPTSISSSTYPSTWRYCLSLGPKRDDLRLALGKAHIFASTLFPPPARIFSHEEFPVARQVADETLNIPYRFRTVARLLLSRAAIRRSVEPPS